MVSFSKDTYVIAVRDGNAGISFIGQIQDVIQDGLASIYTIFNHDAKVNYVLSDSDYTLQQFDL